jgi:hypothetical protein
MKKKLQVGGATMATEVSGDAAASIRFHMGATSVFDP